MLCDFAQKCNTYVRSLKTCTVGTALSSWSTHDLRLHTGCFNVLIGLTWAYRLASLASLKQPKACPHVDETKRCQREKSEFRREKNSFGVLDFRPEKSYAARISAICVQVLSCDL